MGSNSAKRRSNSTVLIEKSLPESGYRQSNSAPRERRIPKREQRSPHRRERRSPKRKKRKKRSDQEKRRQPSQRQRTHLQHLERKGRKKRGTVLRTQQELAVKRRKLQNRKRPSEPLPFDVRVLLDQNGVNGDHYEDEHRYKADPLYEDQVVYADVGSVSPIRKRRGHTVEIVDDHIVNAFYVENVMGISVAPTPIYTRKRAQSESRPSITHHERGDNYWSAIRSEKTSQLANRQGHVAKKLQLKIPAHPQPRNKSFDATDPVMQSFARKTPTENSLEVQTATSILSIQSTPNMYMRHFGNTPNSFATPTDVQSERSTKSTPNLQRKNWRNPVTKSRPIVSFEEYQIGPYHRHEPKASPRPKSPLQRACSSPSFKKSSIDLSSSERKAASSSSSLKTSKLSESVAFIMLKPAFYFHPETQADTEDESQIFVIEELVQFEEFSIEKEKRKKLKKVRLLTSPTKKLSRPNVFPRKKSPLAPMMPRKRSKQVLPEAKGKGHARLSKVFTSETSLDEDLEESDEIEIPLHLQRQTSLEIVVDDLDENPKATCSPLSLGSLDMHDFSIEYGFAETPRGSFVFPSKDSADPPTRESTPIDQWQPFKDDSDRSDSEEVVTTTDSQQGTSVGGGAIVEEEEEGSSILIDQNDFLSSVGGDDISFYTDSSESDESAPNESHLKAYASSPRSHKRLSASIKQRRSSKYAENQILAPLESDSRECSQESVRVMKSSRRSNARRESDVPSRPSYADHSSESLQLQTPRQSDTGRRFSHPSRRSGDYSDSYRIIAPRRWSDADARRLSDARRQSHASSEVRRFSDARNASDIVTTDTEHRESTSVMESKGIPPTHLFDIADGVFNEQYTDDSEEEYESEESSFIEKIPPGQFEPKAMGPTNPDFPFSYADVITTIPESPESDEDSSTDSAENSRSRSRRKERDESPIFRADPVNLVTNPSKRTIRAKQKALRKAKKVSTASARSIDAAYKDRPSFRRPPPQRPQKKKKKDSHYKKKRLSESDASIKKKRLSQHYKKRITDRKFVNVKEKKRILGFFADFFNDIFGGNQVLSYLIPLAPNGRDMLMKLQDGILLCFFCNYICNELIDFRVVNYDPTGLSYEDCMENLVLVVQSTKSIGITGATPQEIFFSHLHTHACLNFLWALLDYHLFSTFNMRRNSEYSLKQNHADGEMAMQERRRHSNWINSTVVAADVLKWANKRVSKLGQGPIRDFFDSRLSDGTFFIYILATLAPKLVDLSVIEQVENFEDALSNASYAVSLSRKLGVTCFITPEEIVQQDEPKIFCFCASLMNFSIS